MKENMRPEDRKLWDERAVSHETVAEPTHREETLQLAEHANIDLEYARKQLENARHARTRSAMLDCLSRAGDALDRIADAHASIIIAQGNAQKAPAKVFEWSAEEILAQEG